MSPPLPVVSGAGIIKALASVGIAEINQRGSHVKLRRADSTVIVPMHKELAPGTLRSIIRQAGLSVDDFLDVLLALELVPPLMRESRVCPFSLEG